METQESKAVDPIEEEVTGELQPIAESDKPGWIIEGEDKATWQVDRIIARRKAIKAIEDSYYIDPNDEKNDGPMGHRVRILRDKLEQTLAHKDKQIEGLEKEIEDLKRPLQFYLEALIRADTHTNPPKYKDLANGRISLIELAPILAVDDKFKPEENKDNPFIYSEPGKLKWKLDRKKLDKHIRETGEVFEWAQIKDRKPIFKVEVY